MATDNTIARPVREDHGFTLVVPRMPVSPARQRLARVGVALGTCALLAGCVADGLAFRVDERLTFVAPEDRSTVKVPVKLDWDIRDFDVVKPGSPVREDAGYFAVFVDAAPMPPGKPLSWIARKDNSCRPADGCPDAEYLNARGIYTTTETELVLQQLPRTSNDDDRRERHRATIILLDSSGKRIGESAFEVLFDIEREAQS